MKFRMYIVCMVGTFLLSGCGISEPIVNKEGTVTHTSTEAVRDLKDSSLAGESEAGDSLYGYNGPIESSLTEGKDYSSVTGLITESIEIAKSKKITPQTMKRLETLSNTINEEATENNITDIELDALIRLETNRLFPGSTSLE